MKRVGGFVLAAVLAACGGLSDTCPEGSGPESVIVDASAYADRGILEICVNALDPTIPADCFEDGTAVSTELTDEYPSTYLYAIYVVEPEGPNTLIREGSFSLSCDESAITVGFDD
ncbi:MAG: hypothetical protein ABFR53_10080 [Actinomycetota bacterium]